MIGRSSQNNFRFPKLSSLIFKAQSLVGSLKLKLDLLMNVGELQTGGKHWVLDSSCSQHMTGNDSMFTSLGDPGDHDHITYEDNTRGRVAGL
jgi:hypothetical protein